MTQDSSTFWKKSRVELRAAGFEPDAAAKATAVVTIASAWTNAHLCNNRVRTISDLLIEILAERGGELVGYAVGALLTGILADLWTTNTAIFAIGGLTILSALVIQLRMRPVS